MFEPSRHVASFNIAGFKYWDGALVLDQLKAGMLLDLVPEPDNPHDPNAVALYFHGTKLGFVPASQNELMALMFHFGHDDVFECRIQQVDPDAAPYEQVLVGLFVTDVRAH